MEEIVNYNIKVYSNLICIILLAFLNLARAEPLHVGSFNVNSNKTSPTTIAKQMIEQNNIDIWGVSESANDWPSKIKPVISQNANFDVVMGTTGRDRNRLQIYYNKEKFSLVSHTELDEINKNNAVRSPLVARFLSKDTKREFLFMVNHLYRANSSARLEQSIQLNQWVQQQELPVIAVGDYNFDMSPYDVTKRGEGYDAIIKNNVLRWIQPEVLLPTQCSKYKSILDFIFVSDKLEYNTATSTISYPENEYCSNPRNSDHRPLIADIDMI